MADEKDKDDGNSSEPKDVQYVRKKNIIPGVDNDLLLWLTALGIGGVVIAPHVRAWIDSVLRGMPQGQGLQQLPANGAAANQQQQQILNAPQPAEPTPAESKVTFVEPQQQQLSPLQQHEKALADQAAYAAAMEKESLTGSQSISMLPERTPRERKYHYEAGSNVSAGYT